MSVTVCVCDHTFDVHMIEGMEEDTGEDLWWCIEERCRCSQPRETEE